MSQSRFYNLLTEKNDKKTPATALKKFSSNTIFR